MTENSTTPHMYHGGGGGYPPPNAGPVSFNGMPDVPPGNMMGRPGSDYPAMQNNQYYGGGQGNFRPGSGYPMMQKGGSGGPMSSGRHGWGPMQSMPPGQPRYMMPSGPGSTPTLNQLLQSPTPDGWHPASDYGMQSQQRMMQEESTSSVYGGNQPGWQRMGPGSGPYLPQHQPGMQNAPNVSVPGGGFDTRRPGSVPGGVPGGYGPGSLPPPQQQQQGPSGPIGSPAPGLPSSHQVLSSSGNVAVCSQSPPGNNQSFSPVNHSAATQSQMVASPSVTQQHTTESGTSLQQQQQQRSSPQVPQLPTKSHHSSKHKTKKHQQQQQQQQQQHVNLEDNQAPEGDGSSSTRHNTMAPGPTPNSQHPGLPPVPSPVGSVGSRSDTPASLAAGNTTASPSVNQHDNMAVAAAGQNRLMSPASHSQGANYYSQPHSFPGPPSSSQMPAGSYPMPPGKMPGSNVGMGSPPNFGAPANSGGPGGIQQQQQQQQLQQQQHQQQLQQQHQQQGPSGNIPPYQNYNSGQNVPGGYGHMPGHMPGGYGGYGGQMDTYNGPHPPGQQGYRNMNFGYHPGNSPAGFPPNGPNMVNNCGPVGPSSQYPSGHFGGPHYPGGGPQGMGQYGHAPGPQYPGGNQGMGQNVGPMYPGVSHGTATQNAQMANSMQNISQHGSRPPTASPVSVDGQQFQHRSAPTSDTESQSGKMVEQSSGNVPAAMDGSAPVGPTEDPAGKHGKMVTNDSVSEKSVHLSSQGSGGGVLPGQTSGVENSGTAPSKPATETTRPGQPSLESSNMASPHGGTLDGSVGSTHSTVQTSGMEPAPGRPGPLQDGMPNAPPFQTNGMEGMMPGRQQQHPMMMPENMGGPRHPMPVDNIPMRQYPMHGPPQEPVIRPGYGMPPDMRDGMPYQQPPHMYPRYGRPPYPGYPAPQPMDVPGPYRGNPAGEFMQRTGDRIPDGFGNMGPPQYPGLVTPPSSATSSTGHPSTDYEADRFAMNGEIDAMRRTDGLMKGVTTDRMLTDGGIGMTDGGFKMEDNRHAGQLPPNSQRPMGNPDGAFPMKPSAGYVDEAGRARFNRLKRDRDGGPPGVLSPVASVNEDIDNGSNASWPSTPKSSHNDVLNKLAEMGDEPDRRALLERIFAFMDDKGTPIVAVPMISKIPVDLYRLYHYVRDLGGMVEVSKNKKWRDVSSALNIGPSSSAGFTLKKNYAKHLFAFECRFDRGNIDPVPLLAFLEQPSKKESKKSAAERAAATAAGLQGGLPTVQTDSYEQSSAQNAYRMQQQGQPPFSPGFPVGQPGMDQPAHICGHFSPGVGPTMPGGASSSNDSVNLQNPFSDAPSGPKNPRTAGNYGPMAYDGSRPPYTAGGDGFMPRPEGFEGSYLPGGKPEGGYGNVTLHPGVDPTANRFEAGPMRHDPQYGPPYNNYAPNMAGQPRPPFPPFPGPGVPHPDHAGPMSRDMMPRPGMKQFAGDRPDGYGPGYGMQGNATGGQPWMPPGGCQTNYPPGMYQHGPAGPAPYPPYGPSTPYPPQQLDRTFAPSNADRFQRVPMALQARRDAYLPPPGSVEATKPQIVKLKRLTHRQLNNVDPWRLMMSLKSGLIAESTWALDVLSVLLRDDSTVCWFGLNHLPGLVEVLLEHLRRCLIEIFPSEFDELEIALEPPSSPSSIQLLKQKEIDEEKERTAAETKVIMVKPLFDGTNYSWKTRDGRRVELEPKTSDVVDFVDDKKSWDIYGDMESSILDWQMGRGDTSAHIQSHLGRLGSLAFKRRRFFGSRAEESEKIVENTTTKVEFVSPSKVAAVVPHISVVTNCKTVDDMKVEVKLSMEMPLNINGVAKIDSNDNNSVAGGDNLAKGDADVKSEDEKKNDGIRPGRCCKHRMCSNDVAADKNEDVFIAGLKRKWMEDVERSDDEIDERDVTSLFIVGDDQLEVSRRCVCISNILRGLSMVPGNDSELSRHPGLLAVLSRILLLAHRHIPPSSRTIVRQDSETAISDDATGSPLSSDASSGTWSSDTLEILREDTLVTFANISGQLDLSIFPEEICIPVLDGLLHWVSCGAACAVDPMPTMPASLPGLSPYRLALEALCKMCVTDSNVDLVFATPPFGRIVRVLSGLVRTLSDPSSDQVLREFAIVLASSLVSADVSAARAVSLHRPTVTVLLEFIESADRQAQQVVQTQGPAMLRDSPEMMGTSVDMLRRCATILRAVADTHDGRRALSCQQSRLLHLTISPTLDSSVMAVLADVLFLCSQA